MGKFTSRTTKARPTSAIKSTGRTVTHGGIPAFSRDSKSDLFLAGVANFVSEDTYYEGGNEKDLRYKGLVHAVTKADPEWVQNFVTYLRSTANMRSVAIVTACEYVAAGGRNGRSVINAACQRADEPAEVLAYWRSSVRRKIPSSVQRGVSDAALRLYNERSFIKYDSARNPWRWSDVLQLTHPKPKDAKQSALFELAVGSRYESKPKFYHEALPMVGLYRTYMDMDPTEARRALLADPELIKQAGMTWESLSSFGPMDKAAWEAIIPNMGYMALLRNLRNFDEQKIGNQSADYVINKLSDPEEVANSRQLPFRFYSAFKNAPSLRWGHALETALDEAVKNVPAFKGSTLVLVDTSNSMNGRPWSEKSTATPAETAALFGCALAKSGQDMDLFMFATSSRRHDFPAGGSVLKTMDSLLKRQGEVGWSTNIEEAMSQWNGHDRIVLISDMQTTAHISRSTDRPDSVPVYAFNLGGYNRTVVDPEKNMFEFGGLTDSTFSMINALEQGLNARWPWENNG